MRVIAVDSFAAGPVMAALQAKLKTAALPGWKLIWFDTPSQLLERLDDLRLTPGALAEIEIVSEGGPLKLDGILFMPADRREMSPADFGNRLKGVAGFHPATEVYLSGCRTGRKSPRRSLDSCIAQTVANASGGAVRGARGYIRGTHAQGNEQCFADEDATEPLEECWKNFAPK